MSRQRKSPICSKYRQERCIVLWLSFVIDILSQNGLVVTYLEGQTPLHKSIRYLRREVLWDNDVVLKVVLGFIKGGRGLLLLNKPFAVAQGANKGLSVLYV